MTTIEMWEENIPEIDVQAHNIPKNNLFFWQLWLI